MATLSITIPNAQVQRVLDAVTETLILETPADAEAVRQYIINDLKQLVRTSERRVARLNAEQAITDVDVT